LVDRQVLTVSEITQMAEIRFFPRAAGQSDDDYRRTILDNLIAQALRFRDVERFGATDVSKDAIEARLLQIRSRFAAPADFDAAGDRQLDHRAAFQGERRHLHVAVTPRTAPKRRPCYH